MEAFDRLDAAVTAAVGIRHEIARLEAAFAQEIEAAMSAAEELHAHEPGRARELGMRAVRAELAVALRVSERQAERWAVESCALVRRLPVTFAALADAGISRRAASLVVDTAWSLGLGDGVCDDREIAGRFAEFDAAAADLAVRVPEHRLRPRLARLREQVHAVPADQRHAAAALRRHVRVSPAEDGMAWLTAYLPAVEAYSVVERLSGIALAIQSAHEDDPDIAGEAESLDRLRADLLVDALLGGPRIGRYDRIRPTVVVTVPAMMLLGHDQVGAPATIEGYGPIDAVTARRLTAEAPSLYRMLTDPHTGARLDLSRTTYRPTAELRLWLRLRDETCRFPGCARVSARCDLDHTVAWECGGPTAASNLAHLCRGHHTLKHHTDWRVRQEADGVLTWTSPLGREVDTVTA